MPPETCLLRETIVSQLKSLFPGAPTVCHVDQEQNQTKPNQHTHKVEICKSIFVISYLSLLHVHKRQHFTRAPEGSFSPSCAGVRRPWLYPVRSSQSISLALTGRTEGVREHMLAAAEDICKLVFVSFETEPCCVSPTVLNSWQSSCLSLLCARTVCVNAYIEGARRIP